MNYSQAMTFLESRRRMGMKLGLKRVKALLQCFNNPQAVVPAIHVAGTNGKGSTCAFLESILRQGGYKTGLFTSPFLLSPLEMIQISGVSIDACQFSSLIGEAARFCIELDKKDLGPTEYEIYTAIALEYFKREGCELAVIEVGMGGTHDSTNVLNHKIASVITKISLEHTEFLGKTLSEIAAHKAGIMAPHVPVIAWPQEAEALNVIENNAALLECPLTLPDFSQIQLVLMDKHQSIFHYADKKDLNIRIPGYYQVLNAVMAITVITEISERFPVSEEALRQGLEKMHWPARFELLREDPDLILDSAHNLDGVSEFVKTYKALYGSQKAIVIFGVMKDKDYEGMIRQLSTIADSFLLIEPRNPRALSVDVLKETVDKYCGKVTKSDTINEALLKSLDITENKGVICALGSIYYVGSFRQAFKDL